jgi:hypothetical protein|tara:strand:- start:69 stop:200 length:132 start_codon:yes stop_codon:yes gene_type:complete
MDYDWPFCHKKNCEPVLENSASVFNSFVQTLTLDGLQNNFAVG